MQKRMRKAVGERLKKRSGERIAPGGAWRTYWPRLQRPMVPSTPPESDLAERCRLGEEVYWALEREAGLREAIRRVESERAHLVGELAQQVGRIGVLLGMMTGIGGNGSEGETDEVGSPMNEGNGDGNESGTCKEARRDQGGVERVAGSAAGMDGDG